MSPFPPLSPFPPRGHLAIEVFDPAVGGTIYLEFNPRGFTETMPYPWAGAFPVGPWITSTEQQDQKLIDLWHFLENERQKGRVQGYFGGTTCPGNFLWNCWGPSLMFVDYGIPDCGIPEPPIRYSGPTGGSTTPCFSAGTLVHTEAGLRPIEAVSRGQSVWAFDHARQDWALGCVSAVEAYEYAGPLVTIDLGEEVIRATPLHPFWVCAGDALAGHPLAQPTEGMPPTPFALGRWVPAKELREADAFPVRGTSVARAHSVEASFETARVFNLRVERFGNYAVGVAGLLVQDMSGAAARADRRGAGVRSGVRG